MFSAAPNPLGMFQGRFMMTKFRRSVPFMQQAMLTNTHKSMKSHLTQYIFQSYYTHYTVASNVLMKKDHYFPGNFILTLNTIKENNITVMWVLISLAMNYKLKLHVKKNSESKLYLWINKWIAILYFNSWVLMIIPGVTMMNTYSLLIHRPVFNLSLATLFSLNSCHCISYYNTLLTCPTQWCSTW